MLGMEPARYICHPHYVPKLDALLSLCNEIEGGAPLRHEMRPLQVRAARAPAAPTR